MYFPSSRPNIKYILYKLVKTIMKLDTNTIMIIDIHNLNL